jgi:hypothetical protein
MRQRKHLPLLAFLIVMIAFVFALYHTESSGAHTAYVNQIQSCYRGNVLRRSLNATVTLQRTTNETLLVSVDEGEQAAYKFSHNKADLLTSKELVKIIKRSERKLPPTYPLIPCQKAIHKPHVDFF